MTRALTRDKDAFQLIMRRNNQRLYRVARAIVGDDVEAEDVVQETYVRAFKNLGGFRGASSLSTWLCRIAINDGARPWPTVLSRLRWRKQRSFRFL